MLLRSQQQCFLVISSGLFYVQKNDIFVIQFYQCRSQVITRQLKLGYPAPINQRFVRISIILLKMTEAHRIRKSLTALTGTPERKSYFYCLKMLGILPPPPGSEFEQWVFYTLPSLYNEPKEGQERPLYTPKCLHDVLIASHATTCEHVSFYFSFYHRNLTILLELFLNFAHEVLSEGFAKLEKIYPVDKFGWLYGPHAQWQKVFAEYKKLIPYIPKEVSAHYWNPTDYQSDPDMYIPKEISREADPDDLIDILFHKINNSYPWGIYPPRRWFNEESQYDFNLLMNATIPGAKTPLLFHQGLVSYDQNQNSFVNGKLDPRDPRNIPIYENMKFFSSWDPTNLKKVNNRNYLTYKDTQNYEVSSMPAAESLANYGALSKNTQYISLTDQNKNNLTDDYRENYNGRIPHYLYAKALFDTKIEEFFDDYSTDGQHNGVQPSHNKMHNWLRVIMNEDNFSLTSLVFWPYHSWIDAQIEIYIRRANQLPNNSAFLSIQKKLNQSLVVPIPGVLKSIIHNDDVSNSLQTIQNFQISGDKLTSDMVGFYPVLEYISPNVKGFQQSTFTRLHAAFNARDFIITGPKENSTNIRTSFQFNTIYRDYYMKKMNIRKFYFLNNPLGFNYDYNYQIGSSSDDLKTLLLIDGSNIPKYLADIQNQITILNEPRATAYRVAFNNAIQVKKSLGKNAELDTFKSIESLQVRKLFASGIELYATYPSTLQNGSYYVTLKLHNVLQKFVKKIKHEKEYTLLEKFVGEGLIVDDIFVFGKQGGAVACPKCSSYKIRYSDLDEKLRLRAPAFWKQIHLESLNKEFYDSNHPNRKLNCIYDMVTLVPHEKFIDYRLVSGAEEIEVEIASQIESKESQFIRVDAECYSIQKGKIHNILSKKFYSFSHTKFDFYKSFDVDNETEKPQFDKYVYKVLKGWVALGAKRVDFSVKIPCYQRLLRLKVDINQEKEHLRVLITDSDYDTKVKYYEAAYQS